MRPISTIVVHHTASPRSVTLETITRWHKDKGWNTIGYHWFIDGAAKVWEGRPESAIGAHCRGHNLTSLGVAVAGDNTREEHAWTGAQWLALILHLEKMQMRYPTTVVKGHRDMPGAATDCPGVDLDRILTAENPLRAAGVVAGGD